MHRLRNLALLLGLFAAAPLNGQTYVYLAAGEMAGIGAAVGAGIQGALVAQNANTAAIFATLTASLATLDNQLVALAGSQAGNTAALAGIQNQYAATAAVLTTINTTMGTYVAAVGTNSAVMAANKTSVDSNTAKLATVATNLLTLNTTIQNSFNATATNIAGLTTTLSTFRASITNALANSGNQAAYELQTNIAPRLELMTDILRTNVAQITINNTNEGSSLNLTNVINTTVTVPSMTNIEAYAKDARDGSLGGSFLSAKGIALSPPTFAELQSEATASSPFGALAITAPTVDIPTMPSEFMRISVPKPMGGGSWVFDMNPMTHFPGVVSGFRTAVEWVLTIGFLAVCGKLAHDFMTGTGSVTQLTSPKVEVLGNNLGLIVMVAYVAIYVAIAALYSAALGGLFNYSGTEMAASLSRARTNPFAGFSAGSIYLPPTGRLRRVKVERRKNGKSDAERISGFFEQYLDRSNLKRCQRAGVASDAALSTASNGR